MNASSSNPLYSWMIEQFKPELPVISSYADLQNKAREVFLLQALVLLDQSGQRTPPFDPFTVTQLRKISRIVWVDSGDEACLVPDSAGFSLFLRRHGKKTSTLEELQKDTRVRSTVAHEIGHTYFFDITHLPPKQGPRIERLSTGTVRRKEEWWCFDFARQLLLPDHHVRKFLASNRSSGLNLAIQIRRRFNVSWDIILRKLVHDLKIWGSFIVYRLDVEAGKIALSSKQKNIWKGKNSKIKDTSLWFTENQDFLGDCIDKIDPISGNRVTKFGHPSKRVLTEFLRIYQNPTTFLCLVRESDDALDQYT